VLLNGLDFRDLFQWLSNSMKRVSGGKIGEAIRFTTNELGTNYHRRGQLIMWKTLCQSVVGSFHVQTGLPCQDYGAYKLLGQDVLIGALWPMGPVVPNIRISGRK
jgi:hypothetical protein